MSAARDPTDFDAFTGDLSGVYFRSYSSEVKIFKLGSVAVLEIGFCILVVRKFGFPTDECQGNSLEQLHSASRCA